MLYESAVSLFCDDIREEKSGLETIVGVYPDNISVSSLPYTFPKIGIYTRINIGTDSDVQEIRISISHPGEDTELSRIKKDFISKAQADAREREAPIVGIISRVTATPFQLTEPGRVRVTVRINDREYISGLIRIQKSD